MSTFFTLANGNKIPAISIIGIGTQWFNGTKDPKIHEALVTQLKHALSLPGKIHIDAAENYQRYNELAKALKETDKPRDEIWITDKYSKFAATPVDHLNETLKTLDIEYVDLYLIHDPFYAGKEFDIKQAWKYAEQLYKEGKAKNIGVSNFAVDDLKQILEIAEIKPQVNQIEYNAFLQNQTPGIYQFAKENNILLEAYSPLAPLSTRNGETSEFYEVVESLAKKYGKDQGQVLLRWVYQTGVLPVTTSSKTERITKASQIFDFELTNDEVSQISKLGNEHKTVRQYWTNEYSKSD
ncbi:Aldo-keto reductase family 1 member [Wickerhamomyces ciferrii]|uniref:Aldo-keto reductase family 1 member n=1 Tax=Wickerhamomyces ciferrii (strain ATCC 14091 / BCRC 22168 / CBS 111 / JCM 3599 / NBRC 0793 / NRRL Y-1031 F-60-10) TaxID=1206466 RepID=K0KYW7_WICCF|nr:Aldo-keto reductase family 1 member [Wickerhamomyces ciferrii]CCH46594.1 Aldo-keto reductase family 1 member [Wickerhamomyces ciferrii]